MTKTLWCANETKNPLEMPTYKKVTATKVLEIEEGKMNLYIDAAGQKYIVRFNKFKKRSEFVAVEM